ncbi:hypothetical protein E4U41_002480 [Claviceps citrina]|nr:hypothetical protein E4U41_002480 [Claviceps citrina]
MSSHSHAERSRIASSVARVMYINAVYFPNSRVYRGDSPGMLNYSCINRVYYAYASVGPDGGVFLSDEWADALAPVDGVQGALGSLMHLKQEHPHLQVILSVGGGFCSEVFPVVASDALLRDNFARSAWGLVEASGLDGIDIAWEYPCSVEQGSDFVALLATVRTYLPHGQHILTAALPASTAVLQMIDLSMAAYYLDHINLMAYDFFGAWSARSGHHSQLYATSEDECSASTGVAYAVSQGFPAAGLLLGIPTYGRSFLQAAGAGQRFEGVGGEAGTFEYNELPRKACRETVDKRRVAAQCVGGDGGFVTYDNPETVKAKAAFVKQEMLGGLFYWNGPADSQDKSRSLVAAGFRELHSL